MSDQFEDSLRIMHARVMELESELDETQADLKSATASYRKALMVIETAKLYVRADENGDPWPAPAVTLRAAINAFDGVDHV